MKRRTICVPPDRIGQLWPMVVHWLTRSAEKCGDWTPALILESLMKGECLLWTVWDGTKLTAAGVTQAIQTPKGKILTINAMGGKRAGSWIEAFEPIETYARELGCRAIRMEGRKGWQKVFPQYRPKWICLEKELT